MIDLAGVEGFGGFYAQWATYEPTYLGAQFAFSPLAAFGYYWETYGAAFATDPNAMYLRTGDNRQGHLVGSGVDTRTSTIWSTTFDFSCWGYPSCYSHLTFHSFIVGGSPYGGNITFYGVVEGESVSLFSVPEPGAWLIMIVGFGMVGAAARTGRRTARPQMRATATQ